MSISACPVCQARFRGVAVCSRCGADLARPMKLAAKAWKLRESARAAVAAGEFARGFELVSVAQQTQATAAGAALLRVARSLNGQT